MPELPEVENFRQLLEEYVGGQRIVDLTVHDSFLLKNCSAEELKKALAGSRLEAVRRRGKFLAFPFENHTVVNHLRMSGRWSIERQDRTRLTLSFDENNIFLEDLRRLGTLHLFSGKDVGQCELLEDLGVEPLSNRFTTRTLSSLCNTKRELKRLLLDQKKIAGLGNIYSCEALFRAGLHPCRPASSLSQDDVRSLRNAIERTLREAIEHEGTSFDQLYRTADGTPGQFQHLLNVYDREGKSCHECESTILRIKQGQRSSYLCENCQE